MDKPCHPFVIRPWKIRQVQPAKWNAPPVKTGKKHRPLDSKGPKNRILEENLRAGFQEDGLRLRSTELTQTTT